MKLQQELIPLQKKLATILPQIKEHAEHLKVKQDYKNFETRLAWDCLRAVTSSGEICGWYEKYSCNDEHIGTLAKNALKAVYPVKD